MLMITVNSVIVARIRKPAGSIMMSQRDCPAEEKVALSPSISESSRDPRARFSASSDRNAISWPRAIAPSSIRKAGRETLLLARSSTNPSMSNCASSETDATS